MNHAAGMGILIFLLISTAAGDARAIEVLRVLGPEAPGKYKHPASITEIGEGAFYVVYHAGKDEYADDTAVWGSRLAAGAREWEPPRIIADTPFHGDGNAVIWQAPDRSVWLFYVARYGPTWSSSRIFAKVSKDEARTWSDPFVLAFEAGMMVRGRPIVLADGAWLLPIYHEVGDDPEAVSADCTSLFLRRDPRSGRWSESNRIRSRLGCIQPAAAEVGPGAGSVGQPGAGSVGQPAAGSVGQPAAGSVGQPAEQPPRLVCYMRRGGDYQGRPDGWLVRSESLDGGRTWAPGQDTKFPNPNAAIDFLRLRNGHLLLVYNDSMKDRTPLTAAISTDGDRSYSHRRNLAEGSGDFAYPTAIEGTDGKIRVVFTSDERTVIRLAVFAESEVVRP
jgi:predicted neuraminidase